MEELSTFDDLETYLAGVKAAGLCQYPVDYSNGYDIFLNEYMAEKCGCVYYTDGLSYFNGSRRLTGKSAQEWWTLVDIFRTPEAEDFVLRMKDWRERGFWQTQEAPYTRNSLHNFPYYPETDAFLQGEAGLSLGGTLAYDHGWRDNLGVWVPALDSRTAAVYQPGAETAIAYLGSAPRVGDMVFSDAILIPTNGENPERALMFLDLLYRDKAVNRLLRYGLEGMDYVLDDGGNRITTMFRQDSDLMNYPQSWPLWGTGHGGYTIPDTTIDWEGCTEFRIENSQRTMANPYSGFRYSAAYPADAAALLGEGYDAHTFEQIRIGLTYGFYDDPVSVLAQMLAEEEASGYTEYLAALQTGLAAYRALQYGE